MRALSFSQPWLWSILHADKRVENRPWAPPLSMVFPFEIALHAAKSWDADAIGFFLGLGINSFPKARVLYPADYPGNLGEIETEDHREQRARAWKVCRRSRRRGCSNAGWAGRWRAR